MKCLVFLLDKLVIHKSQDIFKWQNDQSKFQELGPLSKTVYLRNWPVYLKIMQICEFGVSVVRVGGQTYYWKQKVM